MPFRWQMKRMKKYKILPFWALVAALPAIFSLAGCVSELGSEVPAPELITLQVEEGGSIICKSGDSFENTSFEIELPNSEIIPVSISRSVPTRAAVVDTLLNPLKELWLWAKLTDDGSDYISGHDLDPEGKYWATGHYWPKDRSLSFLACSSSASGLGFSPDIAMSAGGELSCSFDYTVAKGSGEYDGRDAEVQADILLGMTFNRNAEGKEVPVKLHHALSAVRFVVGSMPYGITLKSIGFSNLYSKATCTVNGELAALNFDWSAHSEKVSYSQSFNQFMNMGENIGGSQHTFVLIPQEFSTDDAQLEIGFTIKGRPYVLKKSLNSILSGSKLDPDHIYTFRIGIPDEIDIKVDDDVAGNVKSNIRITNTGFGPGYIRMALVGNWVNSHGIIIAPWLPEDGEFEGWNPAWEQRSDGFYYYKNVALGGETVPAPFYKYTLTTKDHDGQTLYLSVMTQIIHASCYNIWPNRPSEWKWPISTP